jgi:hypothetical protein
VYADVFDNCAGTVNIVNMIPPNSIDDIKIRTQTSGDVRPLRWCAKRLGVVRADIQAAGRCFLFSFVNLSSSSGAGTAVIHVENVVTSINVIRVREKIESVQQY